MIVGTKARDDRLFLDTLNAETMTDEELKAEIEAIEEEVGEIVMPELKSDPFAPSQFFVNGKMHPRFGEIWEYAKKHPDMTPDEIMAKF